MKVFVRSSLSIFLIALSVQSGVAFAQSGISSAKRLLQGAWAAIPNPPADYLAHNNLNGVFVLNLADGIIWDANIGGPFVITRIESLSSSTFRLKFWFDRGNYEVDYQIDLIPSINGLRVRILQGLEVYGLEKLLWNRIPGTESTLPPLGEVSFNAKSGKLNDDRVRLRTNHRLDAKIIRLLRSGEQVAVLGKSPKIEMIGQVSAYWYRVRCADGIEGWLYGQFVDLGK